MKSKNQAYEPGLDHVRALAAVWIVLYHSYQLLSARLVNDHYFDPVVDHVHAGNPVVSWLMEGHAAVSLFMVLSGFVLTRATLGSEISYGRFIMNRALRIYPMYLAVALTGLAAIGGAASIDSLLATLLPIGAVRAMANLGPFSNSFWSVPVELQFYLVFPFLMLLLRRQGPKQVALFALAATVLRSLVLLTQGDLAYTVSYTIMGRIDEFLAGMLASYYAATRRPMRPAWLVVILPLATASLWFYNQHDGWSSNAAWKVLWPTVQGLIWASFIVCYLPLSRRLPELISRFLAALGEVSYSTYLLHFVLVAAVASRLTPAMATGPHGAMRLTMLLSCLFVLPASIILARLTFAAIEQPFLSLRVRYVTPLDVQPSVDQRVESEE